MTRQKANHAIMAQLKAYLDTFPDMRFGQALMNLGIITQDQGGLVNDPFYTESEKTFQDVIKAIEESR